MEENKYKDILKGIIKIIRNAEHSDIGFASICTYIGDHCPELESEDEQTRKQLLDLVHRYTLAPYSDRDRWVAYLEKMKDFDEQLEQAYKNSDEVQYKRGYDDGYLEGIGNAKKELEKQGWQSITISVDKMVDEFENFKVISCGRIPSFMEIDAYRKGVNDVLSKVLIKKEKPITIGSKKAEGKLGEMIAASKKPAGSGEEDKQLSHKEVTKKSDKVWSEEDERLLKATINTVLISRSSCEEDDDIKDRYDDELRWLSSIKERVQPQLKQEWSKEDEAGFGDTLWAINKARTIAKDENDMGNLWYAENWLKGIKERMQ